MSEEMYWWSAIIITVIMLATLLFVDSIGEVKAQELCKSERIRPYNVEFFTWSGIQDLGNKGQYQPKCI